MRSRPDEPVLRGAREIAELIDRAQDVADALRELLAEAGQRDLPGAALQQRPPSASSSSLICIDRAGWEIEQASAARPKWP